MPVAGVLIGWRFGGGSTEAVVDTDVEHVEKEEEGEEVGVVVEVDLGDGGVAGDTSERGWTGDGLWVEEQLLGPGDLEVLAELKKEAQEQRDWSVSYAWTWARAEGRGQGKAGSLIGQGRWRGGVGIGGVRGEVWSVGEGERGWQDWEDRHLVQRLMDGWRDGGMEGWRNIEKHIEKLDLRRKMKWKLDHGWRHMSGSSVNYTTDLFGQHHKRNMKMWRAVMEFLIVCFSFHLIILLLTNTFAPEQPELKLKSLTVAEFNLQHAVWCQYVWVDPCIELE